MQSDLLLTVEALALDFEGEPGLTMLNSHLYGLYEDLVLIERTCGLTVIWRNVGFRVAQEGWFAFAGAILTAGILLEGFGVRVLQSLLLQDWESAGKASGEA